ncbi:MAG: P-II family nitrogen regulator [Fidelibacterota bacterium]
MKEIKAYIRCSKVDEVISALREIGIENMTVIDVMALGKGMFDPEHYKYSIECVEKYSKIAKIEIISHEENSDKIVNVIQSSAYSGEKGDGLIIVSNIDQAVKIRDGSEGINAI